MSAVKVSNSLAKLVLELSDQQKDVAEIAQILNLKKVQVSTILAFHRVRSSFPASDISVDSESTHLVETTVPQAVIPDAYSAIHERSTEEGMASDGKTNDDELASEDGIFVGEDSEYGDPIFWDPANARSVPNPHLMIMGESGSGKTYAAQCLVAELAQREIPSILFDYGQSFELQHLDPQFHKSTGVREHLIAEEGLPINPLQVFPRVDVQGPRSVATRVSDVFDAAYHLGDIQRKVVIDAIRSAFEKASISETDSATWKLSPPSLLVLQNILDELAANRDYPNYRNAGGVAARLMTFFMLSSFAKGPETWSWEKLFGDPKHKVNILQFRGLEGKTQRVLVELLLWHLFFYLKSHGQGKLRFFIVLDEAHHLSFRENGPVNSLLREARKFGLGVIFASQQPEDFSSAAYSNSASKLIFQISDPTLRISKLLAAKCSNYSAPEEIAQLISVMKQGEAFFITQNKGYLVRLADFRKRATLWQQK
jgi:DNA phosphorothioation-dependent restriction protein DptH